MTIRLRCRPPFKCDERERERVSCVFGRSMWGLDTWDYSRYTEVEIDNEITGKWYGICGRWAEERQKLPLSSANGLNSECVRMGVSGFCFLPVFPRSWSFKGVRVTDRAGQFLPTKTLSFFSPRDTSFVMLYIHFGAPKSSFRSFLPFASADRFVSV